MTSKIIAGTTAGTALNFTSDTSGALEIQTGAVPTTAMSVSASQAVVYPGSVTFNGTATFSGTPSFPTAVPVSSGGTGATTLTSGGYLKGAGTSAVTSQTGAIPVADGGTGAATLAANNVLLGNGTSAVQVVAPGTNGNVLTSNGTTWTSATPTPNTYAGARAQVFNASGTFTIPTGISALKVTVMGGGGGGTGSNPGCCGNPVQGGSGNASSIASGNQAISAMTANGGGGLVAGVGANNGTVSGQAINGSSIDSTVIGTAGAGPYGGSGFGGKGIQFYTSLTPGANLAVTRGAGGAAGGVGSTAGGGGIVVIEW